MTAESDAKWSRVKIGKRPVADGVFEIAFGCGPIFAMKIVDSDGTVHATSVRADPGTIDMQWVTQDDREFFALLRFEPYP